MVVELTSKHKEFTILERGYACPIYTSMKELAEEAYLYIL